MARAVEQQRRLASRAAHVRSEQGLRAAGCRGALMFLAGCWAVPRVASAQAPSAAAAAGARPGDAAGDSPSAAAAGARPGDGAGGSHSAGPSDTSPPVLVTVHGRRPDSRDIGAIDVRARELRDVPGTFGDPFQALSAMPGITATASGLPYFYVRGAPPADTGYFLDGIQLPTLFHIGPGPSVVAPQIVDRIEFFPSTAPARFGRFAGGVIAATTTAPAPEARAEASVRLFDASAFVESPIGQSTTAFVAGRYGYPNLLLSLFAPNLSLEYGDYTARIVSKVSDADSLSIFAIGAYDEEKDASLALVPVASQFHRVDLRYDHRWKDGSLRVATTFGYDRTSRDLTGGEEEIVAATSARLRFEVEQVLGAGARLSAGADVNATHYIYEFTGPTAETLPVDAEQVGGAYVGLAWRPAPLLELSPGVRVDAYRWASTLTASVDPKLSIRLHLGDAISLTSALGIAHQQPSYVVPVPGLQVDPSGGLQTTYQAAGGLEARLPWAGHASITGFFDAHRNLSDLLSDCGVNVAQCSAVARVDGRSYGLELLASRDLTRRLGGWIAYTLSRAERWANGVNYLSPFDRPHVLSGVMNYAFDSGIRVGLRATYYSGRPDVPTFVFAPGAEMPSASPLLQRRLVPYYRIDLRAEKRWQVGRTEWVAAVLEFFNATLSKEAIGQTCQVSAGRSIGAASCNDEFIGPISLPSVGVEGGF